MSLEGEEAEEEASKESTKEVDSDDESQDMFADSQDCTSDNPLLAAISRKDTSDLLLYNTPREENRNPFAKRSKDQNRVQENSTSASVFDDSLTLKPAAPTKKLLLIPSKKTRKPVSDSREKENKGDELKGFQLFLAENQEEFPGT